MKRRTFQFIAGPENYTFIACEQHVEHLRDVPNFIASDDEPIREADPDERCDWCRAEEM